MRNMLFSASNTKDFDSNTWFSTIILRQQSAKSFLIETVTFKRCLAITVKARSRHDEDRKNQTDETPGK